MAHRQRKLLFRDDEWLAGASLGALRRRARRRRSWQLLLSAAFASIALGFGYGIVRTLLQMP